MTSRSFLSILKCLLPGAGIFFASCGDRVSGPAASIPAPPPDTALFSLLPPDSTHIYFINQLTEGLNTNVLEYEYFYNGGGVGVGDFNGDGLQDIYFSGNMTDNKLYLNKGHLQFVDITGPAGVSGRPGPWKTGVSVADVNGDGRPDIFLCYSGKVSPAHRVKQLFINVGNDAHGIPQFVDKAAEYGLADSSYTTQAYFFDYDRDGDLDCLLLNHNANSLPILNEVLTADILRKTDPLCGIKLYRNDKGHFSDVTVQSGINNSSLTYGLGAGIADIDGDGWPDIYISNDYNVPDYYYVNNRHGGFINKVRESFGHVSQFSMGNNVADINNDNLPDIVTLDMLPETNRRQKLLFAPDNYEKFDLNVRSGFHYQYMRNMLQLNNGDGTFSEIGQLSGISHTDWSWAPLVADFDDDGWKDIFVTNGYVRDYTNMDFIKYMEEYTKTRGRLKREDVLDIVNHMPASNVSSYFFRNEGAGRFSDASKRWGIHTPSNSNGAAWVDLDNDGDLDLVINNLNRPAFLYENKASQRPNHHYLQIALKGSAGNTAGIGSKLTIYQSSLHQTIQQMPAQGYQSCVSPILHFGLGANPNIDSLVITWPNGKQQLLKSPAADQLLTLEEHNATRNAPSQIKTAPIFREVSSPIDYHHRAIAINDFKRQPQMVSPMSYSGPCMIAAPAGVFIGASNGAPSGIYTGATFPGGSQPVTTFPGGSRSPATKFNDSGREVTDAVFFDANGDGKPDLYTACGGYGNLRQGDSLLQDVLYLGDGKGHYSRSADALPDMTASAKSCVRVIDINGDGHPDLFIGGRVIPGLYPQSPKSYVLVNDGKGHFIDQTTTLAPELDKIGMVTDAAWADLDGDGKPELIIVGEWMPITVFTNRNGKLTNVTTDYFDQLCTGWWNKLFVGDLDGDHKPEIIAGNWGQNSQCVVDIKHPAELYYKDFDNNGTVDPILCLYIGDTSYPFMSRDELISQIAGMSRHFPDYKSYADAKLSDIFPSDNLATAPHLSANCLRTVYLAPTPSGKYKERPLPIQAQYSPIFTITPLDFDHDGNLDLLLCGNMTRARLRFGRQDANYGTLLKGDGHGNFSYISQPHSGFCLKGDVRSVLTLSMQVLFGVNGEGIKAYKSNK